MTDKRYLENADTGERIWLNPEKNAWEPAPILTNQDTGEKIQLWNDQWVPIQKPKTAVQQMREIEAEDVPIPPMRQEGRPEIQDAAIGIRTKIDPMQREILRREGIEYDKPAGYKPGTGIEPIGSTQYVDVAPLPLGKRATKTQQQESVKRERLWQRDIEERFGKPERGFWGKAYQTLEDVAAGGLSLATSTAEMLIDVSAGAYRGMNKESVANDFEEKANAHIKSGGDYADPMYVANMEYARQIRAGNGPVYERVLGDRPLQTWLKEINRANEQTGLKAKELLVQDENGKVKLDWEAFEDPKLYTKIVARNAPQLLVSALKGAQAFRGVIAAGGTEAAAVKAAANAAGSVEAAMIFTETYNEARERGLSELKALGAASTAASVGFAVSRGIPGFGGLIRKVGKGKVAGKVAQVAEEGFEGLFFRNAAKSPAMLKRAAAQATVEAGQELSQEAGTVGAISAIGGKYSKEELIGRGAMAVTGGGLLGGLAGGAFGPKQLFGKSRSDVAMEAILASGGKHENLAPVETRVANVRQAIESAQRDLDVILALDETERTDSMNKRAQVLQQQIAGMESAIAGLEAEATTADAGKAIAPVATASQSGLDAEQALQKGEAILETIEDPSNKLKGEIENLRLEADLAALEVQNLERDLAPVIRGSQAQYASDEEIEAGEQAERDLVAARRKRDQILKNVSKRLNGLINPMAEKEYAAALKDGRLVPPAPIEVQESIEPVNVPFATVSIRTDSGVERVDLTGVLAQEYQDEEANHNQMVQDIRGSRMTSEERAQALREEGDRFQGIKRDIIERSKPETPAMAQEAQESAEPANVQYAYHGSPYRFDRFSLEHMGKGEGGKARGWGIYLAGSKEVAEWIRAKLIANDAEVLFTDRAGNKRPLSKSGREGIVAKFVAVFEGDIDAALDELKRGATVFTNDDSMRQAYDWLVQNRDSLEYSQKNKGQTYKVEIPGDGSYLLWDKPLSEQPETVKKWVDSLPHEETPSGTKIKFPNGEEMLSSSDPDGSRLYEMLAEADPSMGQEGASKFLRDIGVTGIKYLDGSEGSYNYVVFDDSAVKILETYYQDTTEKDRLALDLAGRSKSETPTMAQEVQDVESGTAPAVAPVVEQQPTTGQLPGETLGLDEAAGAVGHEVSVSDVNATEEGLALTSRLFPRELERIREAVERGGQLERSTDVNGNEVLTLRTQRTFTGYPSYWQMTRVGDGAVMIDVVIFPDGEAHIAYTEAQGTSGSGRKAIKNAVVTALADGQDIDRVTGQTVVVQSFINRARYNGSTWDPSNSTMTTPVESILNDDLLIDIDFDYDLAARALSEAQAQHIESSQDAFERSRGGVSDVGAIVFDPFENTKKAISESMRTANAFGAQSIYEITVALVKDLARIGNVSYDAFKRRIGDLLGPDRFIQFMRAAGGDLELVNLFKQVRVEVAKAAGTVLNPMSAVDVKLAEAGVRTITERLGFGKDDHPEDRIMAIKRAISGLGSSQQETAIKVMEAFDGVPPSIAKEIASIIHTYRRSDQKTPGESAKKDDTDYFAQARKIADEAIAAELVELQSGDSQSTQTAKQGAERTFQTTVPSDMSLTGRQLSEQDRVELSRITSNKQWNREMLRILPRIRREGLKIRFVQPETGATWMGGITSPAQYMWRSQPMRIIRRTLAKFVADIQNIKRSASEELQALLRVARDPMQNQLVGLALGLASYRPYKLGDTTQYGIPFSRAELKLLFPEMTDDAVDAYYKVTERMQTLKEETVASINRAFEAKKAIAQKALTDPGIPADRKKVIANGLKELTSAKDEYVSRLRSNNAYWPSMRFGNYIWRAYDSEGNQLLTVFTENDGEEGKIQALDRLKMAALQSQKVADAIKNRSFQWNILSDGDPVESPKLEESVKGEGGLIFDLSTAKWLTSAKQLDGELGLTQDLGTALELAIDASYLRDSMKAHEQMRLGVPGWDTDAVKVFQTYLSTTANFIANNNNQKAISDSMDALNKNKSLDPKLRSEAQKQIKTVKHPPMLPQWGQVALTSGFIMQMGGVMSAGIQQLLQIPTVAWTALANFYGGVESAKALHAGFRAAWALLDFTNVEDFQGKSFNYVQERVNKVITPERLRWIIGDKDLGNITNAVRSAIMEAFKSGSLQPKMTSEMLQAESAPGIGTRIADAGVEYLGIVMTKMERVNRMQTIIASAILAAKHGTMVTHGKDGGWSLAKQNLSTQAGVDEVVANAEEFNAATNFVGGRGDLAPYQRTGGHAGVPVRLLFQFTRFGLDYITLMHSLGLTNYRQASANGKSAIRAYMKPHLRAFITLSLLAGPSSYYIVNMLMTVLKMFMGDDAEELIQNVRDDVQEQVKIIADKMTDDPAKVETLANKMTFALEEGIPNLVGVNLHNTLKWQMIMGDRDDGMLTILGKKIAGPFLAPALTGAESIAGADFTLTKGAKSKLTPRAAKNIQKSVAGEFEVGGKKFEYDWWERALKAGSFTTTKESMLYQQGNRVFIARKSREEKVERLRSKFNEAQDYSRVILDRGSTKEQKEEARRLRAQLQKELTMEARAWNEKFKGLSKRVRPIEKRDWIFTGKVNEKLGEWMAKEAGIND